MINKQPLASKQPSQNETGFTLVEMLVVIVIVGVLSAIAAPGWLSFANSRRATAANDQVLQVLRQAQAQATRTRSPQVVEFDISANPPKLTSRLASQTSGLTVELGEASSTQGLVGMAALKNNSSIPADCKSNANCIAFGADGSVLNLVNSTSEEDKPIIITVFAPNPGATSKRCVQIRSLLGAMQAASGSSCD